MQPCWVYILKCADANYYTGHINSLEQRLQQHNEGTNPDCYTSRCRPLKLVLFGNLPKP